MARFSFASRREEPGPGPAGQGTIAPISAGTLNHPAPTPTPSQYGGTVEVMNTDTVNNMGRAGYPANPGMISLPNLQSASRGPQFDTSFDIQVQPAPGRIMRVLFQRVLGYTGGSAGDAATNGFPYNAEFAHIPHQSIPRNPMGPSPMVRGWDNNAPISAVYAGNPRGR